MERLAGTFVDIPQGDANVTSEWTFVKRGRGRGTNGQGSGDGEFRPTRVYKPNGDLLCYVAWGAIPMDVCELGIKAYLAAGKDYVSTNRGVAAGTPRRTREASGKYDKGMKSHSSVIGYIDSANHKRPCRLTSFSSTHFDDYTSGIPFIQAIDACFKTAIPDAHERQRRAVQGTDFHIEDTAFSTVTVNYNFRTALHKDSGDFRSGFGNLVVLRERENSDSDNRDGKRGDGMLLFPQYKVAVQLGNGDFMAMDVHEWHCNSAMNCEDNFRLSFVCYLRENMEKCATINERLQSIVGDLNCKSWDTEQIYRDIVGAYAVKVAIGTGPPPHFLKWWTMTSADASKRFCLEYKNKRYVLHDRVACKKIHNLIPAWEYSQSLVDNSLEVD